MLSQRAAIVAAAAAALDADATCPQTVMSRRQRWQLLDLDRRGDLAAVVVARRGKRSGLVVEVHCFRHLGGAWVWDQMGPTSDFAEPTLPPRATSGHDGWSESRTQSNVQTGASVGLWHLVEQATQIRTDGWQRPVPPHGWVVAVCPANGCTIEVLDADDRVIGELRTEPPRRIPRRCRTARWWNRRRRRDGDLWFNDAPGRHAG